MKALPRPLLLMTRIALFGVVAWLAAAGTATAQETVAIEVPSNVSFPVTNVSVGTSGAPDPVTVRFSQGNLGPGRALRISVQADGSTFTPPAGGVTIPASSVSWTSVGVGAGTGFNGTLSASTYAIVFQSDPGSASGHVDLGWTLAAPPAGIRAGNHQLTIRWKLEAITP